MVSICLFTGLLLSLAGAEVINEAKTYTKKISKMSDLGKDDQVIIEKGKVLIAQYVCNAGKCTSTPNTTGQLTEQSGYLVLTVQNISPFDRFDAIKWDRSGKLIILKDFTPNEGENLENLFDLIATKNCYGSISSYYFNSCLKCLHINRNVN